MATHALSCGAGRAGDEEKEGARALQARRMQVPYKLDDGIIELWVALRASIGS